MIVNRPRIAITGIGFVTPLGLDGPSLWSNLVEGVSGVRGITLFDSSHLATRIAAEVKQFDPEDFMASKTARNIGRTAQFGVAAAKMAVEDAGLAISDMNPDDVGCIVASSMGGTAEGQLAQDVMHERGFMRVSPFTAPVLGPNMTSAVVAMETGALGVNFCIASACASSGHAIGEAGEVIRRGDAKVMLAGGTDAVITPLVVAIFNRIRATSERNLEPEQACRPWDIDRDGFVWGEGSVMFVLEDWEHAEMRHARIRAELAGYGATVDGYHYTTPHPEGLGVARAMRRALGKAGLELGDVDYINAHGTGTPIGDIAETKGIKEVFGAMANKVPVSSSKSMHGHLVGAAGAIEAGVCVLAMENSTLPPTINLERQDPNCDLDYVPLVARKANIDVAMSNSMGLGGHNASLVLRKVTQTSGNGNGHSLAPASLS